MLANFKYRLVTATFAATLLATTAAAGLGTGVARADSARPNAPTHTASNSREEVAIKPIRVELK